MKCFIVILSGILFGVVTCSSDSSSGYDCSVLPGDGQLEIDDCCAIPDMFDTRVVEECEKQYEDESSESDDPADDNPPVGSCAAECVLNRTGMLVRGKIDRASVTRQMTTTLESSPEFKVLAGPVLTKCFADMTAHEKHYDEVYSEQANICNPKSTVFVTCIMSNLLLSCPSSSFNKTNPDCPELKKYIINCLE